MDLVVAKRNGYLFHMFSLLIKKKTWVRNRRSVTNKIKLGCPNGISLITCRSTFYVARQVSRINYLPAEALFLTWRAYVTKLPRRNFACWRNVNFSSPVFLLYYVLLPLLDCSQEICHLERTFYIRAPMKISYYGCFSYIYPATTFNNAQPTFKTAEILICTHVWSYCRFWDNVFKIHSTSSIPCALTHSGQPWLIIE